MTSLPRTICVAAALAAAASSAWAESPKELSERFKGPKVAIIKVDADAGIQAGSRKDSNKGRSAIVEVKHYDDSPKWGWVLQRVFVRFRLDGLKPADVGSVRLCIYGNLGDGRRPVAVDIMPLADKDEQWKETGITWNNAPKPESDKPAGKLTFDFGNTPTRRTEGRWFISNDLSGVIKAKLAGGAKTVSFLLTTSIKEEACLFTKEHSDGAKRSPRLAVVRK